jgi:hypothetical protein
LKFIGALEKKSWAAKELLKKISFDLLDVIKTFPFDCSSSLLCRNPCSAVFPFLFPLSSSSTHNPNSKVNSESKKGVDMMGFLPKSKPSVKPIASFNELLESCKSNDPNKIVNNLFDVLMRWEHFRTLQTGEARVLEELSILSQSLQSHFLSQKGEIVAVKVIGIPCQYRYVWNLFDLCLFPHSF